MPARRWRLLAGMLGKRDQWLRELLQRTRRERFRAALEAALARGDRRRAGGDRRGVPGASCARAADVSSATPCKTPTAQRAWRRSRRSLMACADAGGVPPATIDALDAWRALASWLLVASEPQFRQAVDKRDGFPSPRIGTGRVRTARRASRRWKRCLRNSRRCPGSQRRSTSPAGCRRRAMRTRRGPSSSALLDLLPRLAAQLTLAFRDAGALDFTQGMLAALDALGSEERAVRPAARARPADRSPADRRIPGHVVHAARAAAAAHRGLAARVTGARCSPSATRCSRSIGSARPRCGSSSKPRRSGRWRACRSRASSSRAISARTPGWSRGSTTCFRACLAGRSDPWRGAVAFAPAIAGSRRAAGPGGDARHRSRTTAAEADRVVERVRAALERRRRRRSPCSSARARISIACCRRCARPDIAYAAVELDALAERQAILDLVSLTHALDPARRSPRVACGAARAVVRLALRRPRRGRRGRRRAAVATRSRRCWRRRRRSPGCRTTGASASSRVARCLRPAHRRARAGGACGRACAARGSRWAAAPMLRRGDRHRRGRALFRAARRTRRRGRRPGLAGVRRGARRSARRSRAPMPPARVQVMTLHRAKGLEFDTVIMPGLARTQRNRDAEVLRWRAREQGLLLAPARARGGEADPVYAYLRRLAIDEDRAELARLLYVGCTRARTTTASDRRIGAVANDRRRHARGSRRAPRLRSRACGMRSARRLRRRRRTRRSRLRDPCAARPLTRVERGWTSPASGTGCAGPRHARSRRVDTLPFDWARETARCIGVVAHRLLAQFGREGLAAWNDARVAARRCRASAQSFAAKVSTKRSSIARPAQVRAALANVLADERGRWLFAAEHADAASEWALAGVDGGRDRARGARPLVRRRRRALDRRLQDRRPRRRRRRRRSSIARRSAIASSSTAMRASCRRSMSRPIRLGLYHPLLRGWREWPLRAMRIKRAAARKNLLKFTALQH